MNYLNASLENLARTGSDEEKAQAETIKHNVYAIGAMENPHEYIQSYAFATNPQTIKDVNSPSDQALAYAIQANVDAIKFIEEPSNALKFLAISESPTSIRDIKNPTEDMKALAKLLNPIYSQVDLAVNGLSSNNYEEVQETLVKIKPEGEQEESDVNVSPITEDTSVIVKTHGGESTHYKNLGDARDRALKELQAYKRSVKEDYPDTYDTVFLNTVEALAERLEYENPSMLLTTLYNAFSFVGLEMELTSSN